MLAATKARVCLVLSVTASIVSQYGCTSVTPHENFLNNLGLYVGRDFRNIQDIHSFERRSLSNGNIEYRRSHQYRAGTEPCVLIYEVSPISNTVVRTDYVGTPNNCAITP